eukprot:UN04835
MSATERDEKCRKLYCSKYVGIERIENDLITSNKQYNTTDLWVEKYKPFSNIGMQGFPENLGKLYKWFKEQQEIPDSLMFEEEAPEPDTSGDETETDEMVIVKGDQSATGVENSTSVQDNTSDQVKKRQAVKMMRTTQVKNRQLKNTVTVTIVWKMKRKVLKNT